MATVAVDIREGIREDTPSENADCGHVEPKENKLASGLYVVYSYLMRKVMETIGLKLTRVQEVYWRSVQRRMILGELIRIIKNNHDMKSLENNDDQVNQLIEGKIEEIPYELVESLVKNDPAIDGILTAFLDGKGIGISHPIREPPPSEKKECSEGPEGIAMESIDGGSMQGTDEPDTGEVVPQQGMNTSKCIRACDIHDFMKNTMKCEMGNEEECLTNKGGFCDQVMLASEVFRREYKKKSVAPEEDTDGLMEIAEDYDICINTIVDKPCLCCVRSSGENDDDKKKDITLRSIWQFLNYWVPLRVSHFKFKYVDDADDKQPTICNPSNGHTELKKRWKKAARWPLFTYWLMFVQTFIMIITLSVYGFAPLGYTSYTERALVQQSNLAVQVVEKTIIPNIWAGPPRDALILLGANYGPCMRRDRLLYEAIDDDREMEAMESGCCVQRDSSGCVQVATREDCPTREQFADFIFEDSQVNTSLYTNRTVCGTSPRTCTSPDPSRDSRWRSDVITDWPICLDSSPLASNDSDTNEYLTCNITGRPCCVGIQAVCIITTQEHCDFLEGKFHDDAFLCAQVDCLGDLCGLTPFFKPDNPDHLQRLGLALFLHAGIFHLLLTILFDFYILRDLEKYLGWLSTSILYLGSGIGGNIISALFVPYSPEVGPAASIFGVISFFLVFITYHWFFLKRPWFEMLLFGVIILVLIFIGLFPYVDNYARLGGMLFGLLFSFILIHYIKPHESVEEFEKFKATVLGVKAQRTYPHKTAWIVKVVLLIFGIVVLIPLFIFSFVWFYSFQNTWDGFTYLNCIIPTSISDLCLDFGQTIRSRDIV